jgi:hypothetical protein
MAAGESSPQRMTATDETDEREPAFSADGREILFLRDDGFKVEVCRTRWEAGKLGETGVVASSGRSKRSLKVSPCGRRVSWLEATGDLVIAGKSAYFLQAFRRIGLVPDGGSTYLLVKTIGRVRAMEMALLGEKLPAETALQWGLVNRVVDDAKLMETAKELAVKLATGPTVALSLARRCIWDACDDDFGTALHNERVAQRDALALARREPVGLGIGLGLGLGEREPQRLRVGGRVGERRDANGERAAAAERAGCAV